MLVLRVLKKKFKSLPHVMVEGKTLKRFGNCFKQFNTWLDRKIGYLARSIMWPHVRVVPNQIMFLPFNHSVSCNMKYISEEIIRRKADVELYWSVTSPETASIGAQEILARDFGTLDRKDPRVKELQEYIDQHVHFVKTNSYEYFHAAASSRVIYINSLLGDKFYPFPTKKEQHIVQTWHGSLGIKRFDIAHYNTNLSWPVAAMRMGRLTTECISNSTFEDGVFRETFWKETPILKLGHARNDIFFPNYEKTRAYLRGRFIRDYDLPEDIHFALYAPTFRDNHNFAVYDLHARAVVKALSERFGGKWCLLLRYHDNDKENEAGKNTVRSNEVIDVTKYPDMQELLAITEVGITDYSSWIYDYVLMRRPGFIFAMDIEDYNNERGFYFKLEDTPFPVATDTSELVDHILSFNDDVYQKKVTEFLSDKGCMDDGHAQERIADVTLQWLQKA